MFKFLKYQYQMGKLTKEKLHSFVPRFITEEQYNEIVGEGGDE